MKKFITIILIIFLEWSTYAQVVQYFTTLGTTTWAAPAGVTSVSVLVVGGGGSGGNNTTTNANGGGGGGGVIYNTSYTVIPGNTYTVTVGAGGSGICNGCNGVGINGQNSVFGTLTAIGGGGGGSSGSGPGQNGGSGGGAAYNYQNSGSSTQVGGFGNAGGASAITWTGAGGGGAGSSGAIGGNASPGGNGGQGYACSITGTTVVYAGGGGGGGNSSERAGDGFAGGGRGFGTTSYYSYNSYPVGVNSITQGSSTPDAIPNSGGGGGAGSYWAYNVGWNNGSGAGGSGIVIVSYCIPPVVSINATATTVCAGASLTLSGTGASTYAWTGGITDGVAFVPASTSTYTVTGTDANGCTNTATKTITVNQLPAGAGTISGTTTVCQGQNSVTYAVSTIAKATSYIWTLPTGATGTSTTNSITVSYGATAVSGNIAVKGNNSCGDGTTSTLAITVNPLPAGAGTISGTTTVCQEQNSVTYTVSTIANATSYIWTLPTGATGTSTTNSITVSYGATAVSGNIAVKGNNSCGDGTTSTLAITVNPLPAGAGTISGTTTVCQEQNSVTYTVSTIANATSYIWTLPTGATGTSTTNSITVSYGATAVSGNIAVKGNNSCGDGTTSTLAITVNPLPAGAGTISGTTTVCQEQNSVTYTVSTIANATSYIWTLPTGATGTSTTNSITVSYGATAVSGNIAVKGNNSCGDGTTSTLAITVNPLPAGAGTISGTTTVCQEQNSVTYTVSTIANATSYIWTLPTGATGTSTTNSITVSYGATAVSGNIAIKGNNSCGAGVSSALPILVNNKPVTPVITQNGSILQSDAINGNQWFNLIGLLNGATNQDYTIPSIGKYYVIVTTNGCSSEPSNTIDAVLTTIESIEAGRFIKVYPNPVSNKLNIEIDGNMDKIGLEIYNSAGQVVYSGTLYEKTVVLTANFYPGVYYLKISTGASFEIKKFIKQ